MDAIDITYIYYWSDFVNIVKITQSMMLEMSTFQMRLSD